jgi:hypothetical protein
MILQFKFVIIHFLKCISGYFFLFKNHILSFIELKIGRVQKYTLYTCIFNP